MGGFKRSLAVCGCLVVGGVGGSPTRLTALVETVTREAPADREDQRGLPVRFYGFASTVQRFQACPPLAKVPSGTPVKLPLAVMLL